MIYLGYYPEGMPQSKFFAKVIDSNINKSNVIVNISSVSNLIQILE